MSDYATKKDVKEIVNKAVEDLSGIITGVVQQVDRRFNEVEDKIMNLESIMNKRFDNIDNGLKSINTKIERLNERLEKSLKDWEIRKQNRLQEVL